MFSRDKKAGEHANKSTNSAKVLRVIERIRMAYKCLRIVVYKLENGEKTVTLRQAAVSVGQGEHSSKNFLKKIGVNPQKAMLPNRCLSKMISLSVTAQYWRYLNQSGKGNFLSQMGQEMLADYLN
jgi:hypothetical protein